MPHDKADRISVTLRLSPELLTALLRISHRAGQPLEASVVSLLWIACGLFELRARPGDDDRD